MVNLDPDSVRAQFDTGAFVSCTNMREMLHGYQEFTSKRPSPIRIAPAFKRTEGTPEGYGYLHVPAHNSRGYLAVRTFYSPRLLTTVIDERDIIKAAGFSSNDIRGENLVKNYDYGVCTYQAEHKRKRNHDVIVHGVLMNGKCYTDVLIAQEPEDVGQIYKYDATFDEEVQKATVMAVHAFQEEKMRKIKEDLNNIPKEFHNLPFHKYVQENTPVLAIRAETHLSDYYLYNAHKHVKGVPKFKHQARIIDICPTCIRAKQTKEPAGTNTMRQATIPYQGLSIDFSFSGTQSNDKERAKDFVGFNGETAWILVTDHYSRMKHGAAMISKAAPLDWLRKFLEKHSPQCRDKYIYLDQGGELYKNPKVCELFEEYGYKDIQPTGADASNQNGPVERGHLTVANSILAMLTGSNLGVKFWPYAFHHWLRINNSMPSRDQEMCPLQIATGKQDDFSTFRTFGCRVWV